MPLSRRNLLAGLAGAAALPARSAPATPFKICMFSKHMQFLNVAEMASACKQMGFDGIDLAVRKGGHVLPERAAEDLPRAVDAIRKAGLEVPMITSGIVDHTTPHADTVLRTASALGIRYYRWGDLRYSAGRPLPEQLEQHRPRVKALAELNRAHRMCAMYHIHSGKDRVGASVWDLWLLLKDQDPNLVSVNLDLAHMTIEGGLGGWLNSARLLLPYARGMAVKDFAWGKSERGGWSVKWCPLGEGMSDWKAFLPMLAPAGLPGPVQMHYEYPLGGAEHGDSKITWEPREIYAAMRRDLERLRGWAREAGL